MRVNEILEIVRNTRKISLPSFGNMEIKAYKSTDVSNIVTEIDQRIENFLKEELIKLMPEVSFVGEEFGGNRKNEKYWLVDPIDGTGHYVRGIPFCTTMLALICQNKVVFSVIYDFVNDVIYHAELGQGAFMNGEKISVSNRQLAGAYLCLETNAKKEKNKMLVSKVRGKANLLQTLCAGFDFILVATGKIEGRIVYDGFGSDYDFAPGSLLVSEAGGIVKNFGSSEYDFNNLNFIASNKMVFDGLFLSEDSIEKLVMKGFAEIT